MGCLCMRHLRKPYFPKDNKIISTNIPYNIKKSLIELNKFWDNIPNLITKALYSQKKYHHKKHRLITFKLRDSVLFKFPFNDIRKSLNLASKYKGPFNLLVNVNNLNFKVKLTLNNKITNDMIHVTKMNPYVHR